MEKLDKIYNVKKVKEILFNNGLNDEQITNYFKLNATKIVEKMKNHKDYGKHFINLTANDYKEVYELMRML
jgi:N-acetylneuraminic acid mutarotase